MLMKLTPVVVEEVDASPSLFSSIFIVVEESEILIKSLNRKMYG